MVISIDGKTKIALMEASVGLATIVTFIAIYLGIIFLIASSAILSKFCKSSELSSTNIFSISSFLSFVSAL